jgi:tetraacyldisaccharide 4'-kinase
MEIPTISGPVLAFCGIARPQQFFSGLEQAGVDLAGQVAFPDHHHYTARDLQTLAAKARAAGAASLLTTEKDAVRLTGLASPLPIATVPLHTEIESSPAALDWIVERLNLRASPS